MENTSSVYPEPGLPWREDDNFFDELLSNKGNNTKLLDNLYKKPIKDKGVNMPHFQTYDKDVINQADILFLPNDKGYKYALVVVDLYDRRTDAEPLKSKSAEATLEGFKKIYSRKILNLPKLLEVDPGTEFQGVVKNYFNSKGIRLKVGLPDRHRQQAIVEQKNLVIGRVIHKRQAAQELITGVPSTEWITDLPKIIAAINRRAKPAKDINKTDEPVCKGKSCYLFYIGDKVRVALDAPRSTTEKGEKLHGKFRASDIRWDPTPRTIENIILHSGMPPLYRVSGITRAVYTKNQLQLIPENESLPEPDKFIRGKPKVFKVEKILKSKKVKGHTYYLIKWQGYDESEATWEPRESLLEDIPDIINKYEQNKK
jgi:hypothetical protein